MTPVDMTIVHNPPASIGDCFRCCIASLLDLPAIDVPHFMERDFGKTRNFAWYPALLDWLRPRGLTYLELNVSADLVGAAWFEHVAAAGFDSFHILSGQSRRAAHAVVARNGVMVHDPAPQKDGLIGPCEDGFYAYGFLVRSCL